MAPRFALAFDPAEGCRVLGRREPRLRALMKRCGPFAMKLRPAPTPFEALAESIVYQQLHGKAAASIFARLKALQGGAALEPARMLQTPGEALRAAGLSQAKALAIQDLSAKTLEGLVPGWAQVRRMEDAEILARFTQVRGIGRWTVEMLLIFRLGRPDVWPVDDFAVRKAYGLLLGIEQPKPREMDARAEAWRPWRTLAAWYLWRSLEG
ncbi:MAG: DNA-3-methyladenine glycosylase 2 family protein [Acidobacteria bacterium]|nr:DNA-3-methyladenine glycosylase 2 family protein [Acidobacteriota bacterium]